MQWWLSPSRELSPAESEALLRRFVEASRRAEITGLMNVARSSKDLADMVSEELCEACEAEVAFVIGRRSPAPPELVGSIGLSVDEAAVVLGDALAGTALELETPRVVIGDNLLQIGACSVLLASAASAPAQRVAVGIARLYDERFDEAEVTLVDAVTRHLAQAIDHFWGREEVLRAQSQLISWLLRPPTVFEDVEESVSEA
jgi:hypothetical protein